MNVYIWQRAYAVTSEWHGEAGVLIVAEDLRRARSIYRKTQKANGRLVDCNDRRIDVVDDPECCVLTDKPDVTLATAVTAQEGLLIFPDAGCC